MRYLLSGMNSQFTVSICWIWRVFMYLFINNIILFISYLVFNYGYCKWWFFYVFHFFILINCVIGNNCNCNPLWS
jgi:hypothetical protein